MTSCVTREKVQVLHLSVYRLPYTMLLLLLMVLSVLSCSLLKEPTSMLRLAFVANNIGLVLELSMLNLSLFNCLCV
jgi:hypothetical protein